MLAVYRLSLGSARPRIPAVPVYERDFDSARRGSLPPLHGFHHHLVMTGLVTNGIRVGRIR